MSAPTSPGAAPPWPRVSALLDEGLALAPPERAAWLAALDAADPALAATVARLLGHAEADAPATRGAFDGLLLAALQHEAQAAPAEPELAGRQFGAWQLLNKIGEGGMGQVWLARRADGLYQAQAAIKLLRSDLQAGRFSERFARERAALARLNHPGIARLLDAGVADGLAFLVLEHVAGLGLAAHVALNCPTVASRVRLVVEIARAVEHAHAQLIVHRDLKPSNVMVTEAGVVKLLDFGIAGLLDDDDLGQLTRQTGRGLTLAYAAPEQLSGAPVGVGADVFSLGVMLFEMLGGVLPFAGLGSPRAATEFALLHGEPRRLREALLDPAGAAARPLDAPLALGDLEAVVAQTLRREPADRYASVGAFIDDLQRWLGHRPVRARQRSWRHRLALGLRRHALAASLSATLALAVLAGLAATSWQWKRAEGAARQSDQVTTYLTELLSSASPDVHGGQSPNVMELLEKSRREVATQFNDEPETKARLLKVLATTYEALNRFDLAAPLAEEWIALSAARFGENDPRTVDGRIKLAQLYTPVGPYERAIALLEPLRPQVARLYGAQSEKMRELLYALVGCYAKIGRFDAATLTLGEAGGLTQLAYGPDSFERAFHHNIVSVLYARQGRLSDSLAELRLTEPAWAHPAPDARRHVLVLRRNTLAMQMQLGQYEGLVARWQAVAAEADQLLGRGSSMRAFMHPALAGYHADRGEHAAALAEREAFLAEGTGAPTSARTGARAELLLAQGRAKALPAATLLAEARSLLAQIDTERRQLGPARAEAWLALARTGLLLQDTHLAGEAVTRLRGDAELNLRENRGLDSRVAQVEGELLRARGDFARSRELLARRVALLATSPDQAVPVMWQARLDLAATLVLLRAPEAAEALAQAAQARPPQMPAGHPLDALQRELQARLAAPGAPGRGLALDAIF